MTNKAKSYFSKSIHCMTSSSLLTSMIRRTNMICIPRTRKAFRCAKSVLASRTQWWNRISVHGKVIYQQSLTSRRINISSDRALYECIDETGICSRNSVAYWQLSTLVEQGECTARRTGDLAGAYMMHSSLSCFDKANIAQQCPGLMNHRWKSSIKNVDWSMLWSKLASYLYVLVKNSTATITDARREKPHQHESCSCLDCSSSVVKTASAEWNSWCTIHLRLYSRI